MSTINTFSVFYYGHTITRDNYKIPFSEGGPQLVANLTLGTYTLTSFCAEIARAMTAVGANTYDVAVDRDTRIITISADANFELLSFSGTVNTVAAWDLIGADQTVDYTGADTYAMLDPSGYEYRTQGYLKDYTSPEHYQVIENSSVQVSASGEVNVVSFGDGARMLCNIHLISNKTGLQNPEYFNSATGVADALQFLNYLKTKAKIEFMPDIDTRGTFHELLLESNKADRDGTAARLFDMDAQGFYETGELVFRKVI